MAKRWQAWEFITAVTDCDFTGSAYTEAQTKRLQAAKRAYLKLPENEQRNLAEIAGRIAVRSYGPLAAFEMLSAVGMMLVRRK